MSDSPIAVISPSRPSDRGVRYEKDDANHRGGPRNRRALAAFAFEQGNDVIALVGTKVREVASGEVINGVDVTTKRCWTASPQFSEAGRSIS